jgi:hypothetical protein
MASLFSFAMSDGVTLATMSAAIPAFGLLTGETSSILEKIHVDVF